MAMASIGIASSIVMAANPLPVLALHAGSTTFNFTGSSQSFTVPSGVTSIRMDLSGAEGGSSVGPGGRGGNLVVDVAVSPGDVLRVDVGGAGSYSNSYGAAAGGWPNGGDGFVTDGHALGYGGGGASSVYRVVGQTATLLATAGGGGGDGYNLAQGGDGGMPGNSASLGDVTPFDLLNEAGGGSAGSSGAAACYDDSGVHHCGNSGDSSFGPGDALSYDGGGGGGGSARNIGGSGIFGTAGGGGASWRDTGLTTAVSNATGARTGNGIVGFAYNVVDPIDSTFSLSWVPGGRIALTVSAIGSGSPVVGTYALYDSATVTGSPLASVSVNGNGANTSAASSRTLASSTRFAVKFTSSNGSYTDQTWENQAVQCAAGSYNATDGHIPCTVASLGHFVAYDRSTVELPAPAGHFVAQTGQATALSCPLGTYQPSIGQSSCLQADIGYYVSTTGAVSQSPCPAGSTTSTTGQYACTATVTAAPQFSSPAGTTVWKIGVSNPTLTYTLGETPYAGSVRVRWFLSSDSTTIRELVMDETVGPVTIPAFDPLAPNSQIAALSAHIVSSTTKIANVPDTTSRMPEGAYVFTVSYQNNNLLPAASANVMNVNLRTRCSAGTYSNDAYTPCTSALPGRYAASDNLAAYPCGAGTFQPYGGQTSCIPASIDHYVNTAGATSETACPAGQVAPNIGSISCVTPPASTTTTIPPTTTPTSGTSSGSTTLKCTVKKGSSISRTCLATNAGITIPSTSKVMIKVVKASAGICRVSGRSVKTLKSGTCSTTVSVTPKNSKKARTYKVKVVVT